MTDVAKILNKETGTNQAAPIAHKSSALEDMELEIKRLEFEDKQLEIRLKKANLVDTEERLAERELKRQNAGLSAKTNGETLKKNNKDTKTRQSRCNHRKGGDGVVGIIGGQGESQYYAVFKHKFAGGNVEVGCMRCHKRWKKPAKSDLNGKPMDETQYNREMAEYEAALNFPTNNKPSSSYTFGFSDQGEQYLTQTANS